MLVEIAGQAVAGSPHDRLPAIGTCPNVVFLLDMSSGGARRSGVSDILRQAFSLLS